MTRSVMDWLHLTGVTPVLLATAVPSVAGWKLAGLPQALTPVQIRALLASCDRRTPTGRRDYAIVLMLARLGLRAGEVARLGMDDRDVAEDAVAAGHDGHPDRAVGRDRESGWARRSRSTAPTST
ncbi:MAG: hypothetical protein WKF82_03210 [Nocardioidaceae bacterium]